VAADADGLQYPVQRGGCRVRVQKGRVARRMAGSRLMMGRSVDAT